MSRPAQLKLVPDGHCPSCGQPLKRGRRRVCATCGKPILKGHKFFFNGPTVSHKNCETPTAQARVETTGGA